MARFSGGDELSMPPAEEIVAAVRRTEQSRCQQIAEWQSLEFGTAFTSREFSGLAEANQLRDAWLVGGDPAEIYSAVEAYYAERGLKCLVWSPALGQPVDALDALLLPRGWRRREYHAMWLSEPREIAGDFSAIRVLPARAMRRAFARLLESSSDGLESVIPPPALVEAGFRRLDDAHHEAFVAMEGDRPVGCISYLEAGESARLADFVISADAAGALQGVRRALLAHILLLARRLLPRLLLARVAAEDAGQREFLESAGFCVAGALVQFERPVE